MNRHAVLAALAASSLLAACDRSPSAAPENVPAKETANAAMASPFAADERMMSEAMMKTAGADVSDTWVKTMIEHHRGAIAMSRTMLKQSPTPEVRKMAEAIIKKQTAEIVKLTAMLSSRPSDPASMEPYHAAMSAMDNEIMAAQGANVSETYLRKMLAHHKGALAMSEIVLARSSDLKVKAAAAAVKADQTKEVRDTEAMLAKM